MEHFLDSFQLKIIKISLRDFKATLAAAMIKTNERTKRRGRHVSVCEQPLKNSKCCISVNSKINLDGTGLYPKQKDLKSSPRCCDKDCDVKQGEDWQDMRMYMYTCSKMKAAVQQDMKGYQAHRRRDNV
uniref:Uncharacterized protein n=1 Tax=Glossina austeni TaxID=7395 RepID=A0A1A9VMS6_GLOAU